MKKVFIINGPNLGNLESREALYGKQSLDRIKEYTEKKIKNFDLIWHQFDSEEKIIQAIHSLKEQNAYALIINPGAYSHCSYAIYDALLSLSCIKIEVHLSNVHERGSFRSQLLTARACNMIMSGLGKNAYLCALNAIELINKG